MMLEVVDCVVDRWKMAADKYDGIDFTPPKGVQNAAKKGLEYRQKVSPSNKGGLTPSEASKEGIGSGVQRAVNLKNGDKVSPDVIGQMVSFFARHRKNKSVSAENKDTPWNDKGYVSWLLWGGDAGDTWSKSVKTKMESASRKASGDNSMNDNRNAVRAVMASRKAHPASSEVRVPSIKRVLARFPKGVSMTVEEVAEVVGPDALGKARC